MKDLNCNRLMGYFGAWDLTRALSMTHSLSMLGLEWHKVRAGCAVKPIGKGQKERSRERMRDCDSDQQDEV
jgi:hypothetical protein